jgi:hypothetical protein
MKSIKAALRRGSLLRGPCRLLGHRNPMQVVKSGRSRRGECSCHSFPIYDRISSLKKCCHVCFHPTTVEYLKPLRDSTSASSEGLLVQKVKIGMQYEREYTVLALAARPGLREIALQLLPRGANPNGTSYQGTSLLAHTSVHLAQARKAQDDE